MNKEKREPEKQKSKGRIASKRWAAPKILREPRIQKCLLLAGFSLIVAGVLTSTFVVDAPFYQLGDIATRNIKAKRDLLIEDKEATARLREEALRQAPIVYDFDDGVLKGSIQKLNSAFQTMRSSMGDLSIRLPGEGWAGDVRLEAESYENLESLDTDGRERSGKQRKKEFERLLGVQVPDPVFAILHEKRFSKSIEERVMQLLELVYEEGILSSKGMIIQPQGDRLLIRRNGSPDGVWQASPQSLQDLDEARKQVRMNILERGGEAGELMVVASLTNLLLAPNLVFNLTETERQREKAYASVKPVYIQVMKNEMLVREGQRIGQEELIKLRAHEQGKTYEHRFLIFLTFWAFSALSMWVFVYVATKHLPARRLTITDFLFLGLVLAFLLTLGRFTIWISDLIGDTSTHLTGKALIFALPLAGGAMMVAVFFGVTLALMFSLLLSLFAGMLFGKDFSLFVFFLIGCFVAAHSVYPCRNRLMPIRAGALVGLSNIVLIVLGTLLQEEWYSVTVAVNSVAGFAGGFVAGIMVTGFTPLAEMAFGYTTDIKLLELVTMDQPLLQELMVQAPGTYHHSIIVSNMVEAAAKSIGANSLLAKVAACYHDIGKIRKPVYYIENQLDCDNRHEKLAPSMSSLILISHVKEGVELAKQHHLGEAVIDIIRQHHGTSLISFFYKKALEAREKQKAQGSKGVEPPPINIDDYRYPGPKPQTKEAGLVMLADVVEAACRSLTEPTPARIQGLVNRLINSVFSDGQLEECELTLKDLHQIAKRFNQILATVHHKRIEYPTIALNGTKGKTDAGDPTQRETKPDRDKTAATQESGRTDLKRLGIH